MASRLTIRDELWNPFEDVSKSIDFADVAEITFKQITNSEKTEIVDSPISLRVEIQISNDMLVMERKRYNMWDALGDIGGFHDGLVLFIHFFFMGRYSSAMFDHSIVQGAKYRRGPGGPQRAKREKLVKKLRDSKGPFRIGRDTIQVFGSTIQSIREIKVGICKCLLQYPVSCLRSREQRLAEEKALDRFSTHLDIQSMIDSDLIVKHVFQFLFTKSQRMLLAYQKERFIEVGSSTDDSESDELQMINEDKFLTDIRKLEVRDDLTKEMLLSVLTRSKPDQDKKKTNNAELELQLVNNNNISNTTTSPLQVSYERKMH